jgi:hypothetical protein
MAGDLNANTTAGVLYVVVVKNFNLPVHPTVCSALISDHLPVLMDTSCRSSVQNLPDRPDFMRMDRAASEACLKNRFQCDPIVIDEEVMDKCVEGLTSDIGFQASASCLPVAPSPRS